jgi:hypothetical protein
MTFFFLVDHLDETVNIANDSCGGNGIVLQPIDVFLSRRFHNLINEFPNEILSKNWPFTLIVHVPLAVNCYRASGNAFW